MTKLHELLAVDGHVKTQHASKLADLSNTFEKKKHHFSQRRVVFKPNEEGAPEVTEEQLDIQTTVPRELKWLGESLVKALDVPYQISIANQLAVADVVLEDGTVILERVPATALLDLEKKIQELRLFVNNIPTLDPAKGFVVSPEQGEGIFKAREDVRTRTKKVKKVLVKYEATDKHPAQTEVYDTDEPVGKLVTNEWSGLITTAAKGDMLERVEELSRAIKKARSRANETEVDVATTKIGAKLVKYLFTI
jgi:hypothetical protein